MIFTNYFVAKDFSLPHHVINIETTYNKFRYDKIIETDFKYNPNLR